MLATDGNMTYSWQECLEQLDAESAVNVANVYNHLGAIMRLMEAKIRLMPGYESTGRVAVDLNIPDRVPDT